MSAITHTESVENKQLTKMRLMQPEMPLQIDRKCTVKVYFSHVIVFIHVPA